MKKMIVVAMMLLMLPGVLGLTATGTEEVMGKLALLEVDIALPVLNCEEAIAPVFAMEVSEGQNPDNVEPFLNALMSDGYYVATVDVSTPEGMASLSCVDVLYVTSIKDNYEINNDYPESDIDTIYAYVINGGGLLYTSDWGQFASRTKDLAERFGIYVDSNQVNDYDDYDTYSYWPIYDEDNFVAASPVFSGVEEHVQLAGTSFLVADTPLLPIIRTDGTASPARAPVAAAGFYEQGCVVTTGDSNWLHTYNSADGFNRVDNPTLALNMVDFLVGCNPDDVDDPDDPGNNDVPEFGAIAALGILIMAGLFIAKRR